MDDVWTSNCCIFLLFFPLFTKKMIDNVLGSSITDVELWMVCLRRLRKVCETGGVLVFWPIIFRFPWRNADEQQWFSFNYHQSISKLFFFWTLELCWGSFFEPKLTILIVKLEAIEKILKNIFIVEQLLYLSIFLADELWLKKTENNENLNLVCMWNVKEGQNKREIEESN